MLFQTKLASAIAAAGLAFAAGEAGAVVYTVTYSGIVAPGGYDTYGTFGVGADLSNRAFTMSFKVDTAVAGASLTADGLYAQILEGADAAAPVAGSIKIGNVTLFFGEQYGYDYRYDEAMDPACLSDCQAGMEQGARDTFFDEENGVITSGSMMGYARTYGYAGQFAGLGHGANFGGDDLYYYGNFAAERFTTTRSALKDKTYTQQIDAALKISSVTVTSAAPEPGTWALLIAGFGLTGMALRRRRATLGRATLACASVR